MQHKTINEIHSRNTRKSKNLNIYISNILTCKLSNSLTVNSIKVWNELPNKITQDLREDLNYLIDFFFYLYIYPPESQESDGGANT